MLNDRLLFALCTSRIQDPEILRSVRAFVYEAHSRGYGVLVFNSGLDTNVQTSPTTEASCASVFDLIPYQLVDMVAVMHEAISSRIVTDMIAAAAKENRVPLLSYDGYTEGVPSVYCYTDQAFDSLMKHIIKEHRCTRINLITGVRGHYRSERLVMAYQDAMRRYGIRPDEERIGYGEFSEEATAEATERFLSHDLPEAIICASDETAVTVCSVLRRHGLRVPEDVIVTGSDGILREQLHSPLRSISAVSSAAALSF